MSNLFGPDAAWVTPSLAGQLQNQYQDVRGEWANKYTRTDIHDIAQARIAELTEALALADATLSGANMDRAAVERKVRAALNAKP